MAPDHSKRSRRDKMTLYDQLATQKVSETTAAQLNASAKDTYIQRENVDFWAGPITVQRILETRCYPNGLPIPEQSAVEVVTVEDSATGFMKPEGTEIWSVQGIDVDNCAIALTDGTNFVNFASDSGYISRARNPIYLTNTLYFAFTNVSGAQQTPSVAYHKVGQ
jgi:hypothetical protein